MGPVTAYTPVLGHQWLGLPSGASATVAIPLLLVAAAYLGGVRMLRRRTAGRRVVAVWRSGAFAGGVAAVALAVLSPLEELGSQLLAAHMVQHLLLLVAAPVLLVLARPSLPLLTCLESLLGEDGRHRMHRLRAPRRWRLAAGRESVAALAWAVHIAVVLAWHLPVAYQAALRHGAVHGLEHLTMLASALAAWWTVLRPGTRRRRGAAVLHVTATAASGGLLAALMTFSARPWYPAYARTAPAWGLTGLQDQQLAGALMWVVGGVLYLAAAVTLFARWMVTLERRTGEKVSVPQTETSSSPGGSAPV